MVTPLQIIAGYEFILSFSRLAPSPASVSFVFGVQEGKHNGHNNNGRPECHERSD